MFVALVVGIIAAVAVIAVIVAVFAMKARSDSHVNHKQGRAISSINTVISAKTPGSEGNASGAVVDTSQSSTGKMSESLSDRFGFLYACAAVVFGVLTIKDFSMQVLSGSSYANKAANNQYATVYTPAPRGGIYDCGGVQMVSNRASLTVLAEASVADDPDVVARLSALLGVPRNVVRKRIKDSTGGAQSQRVVVDDARRRDLAFIAEHSDAFNGVSIETRTVRSYPYGALAAHALGYTGTVSSEDLENVPEGRNLQSSDDVGKSGVEATYDSLLAGEHGQRKVIADANGNIREVVSEVQPSKGSDVYLNIAAPVQYVADRLLQECIAPEDNTIGTGTGTTAAAVVMDVRTGGIVAMASYPTFTPSSFVGGISQDDWNLYNTTESHYPLLNRAIAGAYPAASTYKAFTSLAGLKYGFATKQSAWTCTGSWDGYGSDDIQNCWNLSGHGTLDLRGGIVNSCDVVFYEIAKDFFFAGKSQGGNLSDTAMQDEIARYHFGQATGIDISGEVEGRIPTPQWKAANFRDEPEEAAWLGGDMTNMVIGQGYVLVTPIQLAVAYGAIATGKIMRPQLLKEVRNSQGEVVVSFTPEVVDTPQVNPEHLDLVRDALHGVVWENATLELKFSELGVDAAGKTGTAEVAGKDDSAWFACYGPYEDPHYVVTVMVEEGGGGSATASPIGAELLAAALAYEEGNLEDVGYIGASSGHSVENTGEKTTSSRTD